MALEENFIDVIFYVPKSDLPQDPPPSLRDLLRSAYPVIELEAPEVASNDLVPVVWAGMSCLAYCREDSYHYRLYLELGRADMYEPLRGGVGDSSIPLEDDPLLPLAIALREACELLGVDVAMITTNDEQSSDEYLEDNYLFVYAYAGIALVRLGYALLYLSCAFDRQIDAEEYAEELAEKHDMIVSDCGYLIFGGKGTPYNRWV
jgi:hypothetical protein